MCDTASSPILGTPGSPPESPLESSPERLTLAPHQIDHLTRVVTMLSWHPVYLDVSQMGTGKTVIALMLAAYFKLKLFVVAPAGNLDMWKRAARKYKIPLALDDVHGGDASFSLYSYDKLRGTAKEGCNHDILQLVRTSHDLTNSYGARSKKGKTGKFIDMYGYQPTEKLRQIISHGTMFIFDEIQKIKNFKSESHIACQTIVKTLMEMRDDSRMMGVQFRSRVGLLSALPVDRHSEIGAIIQMMGIVRSKRYLEKLPGREVRQTGFHELLQFCSALDPVTTTAITQGRLVTEKMLPEYFAQLYVRILKHRLSSAMPSIKMRENIDIKNGYYDVPVQERLQIEESYQQLLAATGFNSQINRVGRRNQGQTMEALGKLELHKVNLFARLAERALSASPNNKVIIYVWRSSRTPYILAEKLARYHPIVLTGKTDIKDRPALIEQFQRPDSTRRLIIAHPIVGGIGHDLDDQDGRFPRHIFVSPSYNHNDLYQLTGRTCRHNTKSKTVVRFVYVIGYDKEALVLDNLVTKSAESDIILFEHDNTLPGQYAADVDHELTMVR